MSSCCPPCAAGAPCVNPLAQGRRTSAPRGVMLGSMFQLGSTVYAPAPSSDVSFTPHEYREEAPRRATLPSLSGDSDAAVIPSADELCAQYGHLPGMDHLCAGAGGGAGGTGGGGGYPPVELPGRLPVVTEEQCQAREAAARAEERSAVLVPAIVGGIASAGAGALFGWALSRWF